jgi:hypothetical protein
MSMTFDIPADGQVGVAGLHSAQARAIIADAVRQAGADKSAGFDSDESFAQLREAQQDLTSRL